MCCFHLGIAHKGGGVNACQDGLEHFFPTFAGHVKLQEGSFPTSKIAKILGKKNSRFKNPKNC